MGDETQSDEPITRREALTAIAAASLATSVACTPNREVPQQTPSPLVAPAASKPPKEKPVVDPILSMETLPKGQPWPTLEPFLFCVHHDDDYPKGNTSLGPAATLQGRNIGSDFGRKDGWSMYHGRQVPGFPRHPHRGFETVTVVRSGLVDHADSLGAIARYGRGDVQWLTAGDGINHAEMFPLLRQSERNPIDFFQIWLNLPKKHKRVTPSFAMYWRDTIPKLSIKDDAQRHTELTLVAGDYAETAAPKPPQYSWAADTANDVAIWTLRMDPKAQFTIPQATHQPSRALYLLRGGGIDIARRSIPNMTRIDLNPSVETTLVNGPRQSELLMLQARPIGEPIARHGPFVMNTRDEIVEAYRDYQRTGFGGWPWPNDAPVHGRDDKRFARRPDGQIEEAT